MDGWWIDRGMWVSGGGNGEGGVYMEGKTIHKHFGYA